MTVQKSQAVPYIGFRSLPYRSSTVYEFFTKRLYHQDKKFSIIATIIGNDHKHVLDLPCGIGLLTKFLHPTITYEGWDLNHRFLKKIKKEWLQGRIKLNKVILKQKNIFEIDEYHNNTKDIIVFCDILHHVFPNHIKLIEKAKKVAKKIIICEPLTVRPKQIKAHDWLGKLFIYLCKFLPEKLLKLVDFFLADNDGINSYDDRQKWKHDRESLKEFYIKLGFNKIYHLKDEYIGVWQQYN